MLCRCVLGLVCGGLLACGGHVVVDDDGVGVGDLPDDHPSPIVCPAGGPEGDEPVELGPPAGDAYDLWRALHSGDESGEGQSFTMPRAGVIDGATVQMFAHAANGSCELRLYRYCDGERVLAASSELSSGAFPAYMPYPDSTVWNQDMSETNMIISPPLAVAAGERVDAVFVAHGTGHVSVITMSNLVDDSRAIFPNGGPGLEDAASLDWDFHARLSLR